MSVKKRTLFEYYLDVVTARSIVNQSSQPEAAQGYGGGGRNAEGDIGALPAPSTATPKPAAGYAFATSVAMGHKRPQHDNARVTQETEFATVLRESGYFATVEKESGKDMNIAVELLETVNPAALVVAFITGLILYTIPSWVTIDFEVA